MFSFWRMRKKLQELDERCSAFERDQKQMKLEWEDTYDKLRAIVQRIVKRAQRIEQLSPEDGATGTEPETLPPGAPSNLNQRQHTIQQKILARRRMNGVQ